MMNAGEQGKPDKMAYSIPDAAWVLGDVSPNHVRNLIKDKALDKIRIGRRVLVTAASIKRLLEAGGTPSEREAA
ncbi:MAG: helix-turn-helix domain-containing protein [Pyrinomonadaceae bacterium]